MSKSSKQHGPSTRRLLLTLLVMVVLACIGRGGSSRGDAKQPSTPTNERRSPQSTTWMAFVGET